ncbi:MAG: helix-turn-helix transcriptional regulator [Deltaproteobacteria bacterium]|nr:MAG: helix-turn-helix transcriptional regulator [Deltaproteobacteria bacterium]
MSNDKTLPKHGGDRVSEAYQGNDRYLGKRGNSSRYHIARLKRDHPDIAEALARGEYPSVHAAAKAAGLVREPTPLQSLYRSWRKVSPEERRRFLLEMLTPQERQLSAETFVQVLDEPEVALLAAVLYMLGPERTVDALAEALTIKANASSSSYAPRCPRTLRCSSSPSTVSPVEGSSQSVCFFLTAYDFRRTLMSSFFDDAKGSKMLASKLIEAANLAGLSQSDIARHFGITRSQVNLWARNKRVVPKRYREALVTLFIEAYKCALGQTTRQPVSLREAAQMAEGLPIKPRPPTPLQTRMHALCDAWLTENLEAHGLGPTASVHGVLEALEAYKAMTPAEMRKPANAQRLQALGAYLQDYANMLKRIGPIEDIIEEDEHDADHCRSSRECGAAGAAKPRAE